MKFLLDYDWYWGRDLPIQRKPQKRGLKFSGDVWGAVKSLLNSKKTSKKRIEIHIGVLLGHVSQHNSKKTSKKRIEIRILLYANKLRKNMNSKKTSKKRIEILKLKK